MSQQTFDLFLPDTDWVCPNLSDLPDLTRAPCIGFDTETYDPHLLERGPGWATGAGHMAGFSVAIRDGNTNLNYYLPIRHERGTNLDVEGALRWARDQFKNPDQPKIGMNVTYDVGWFLRDNVKIQGPVYDVQVAGALLDESARSYNLNALGERYLKEKKSEALLYEAAKVFGFEGRAAKAAISKLPPEYVGIYAEIDADLCVRLWDVLKAQLEEQNLREVFKLETKLQPLLLKMRMEGVRFDLEKAAALRSDWTSGEQKLCQSIQNMVGSEVNIWSAQSVEDALAAVGVTEVERTETGKPSFTSSWLENHAHPVAQQIKQQRKLSKGVQFLDSLIDHAEFGNGRIHAQINALRTDDYGTVSGRFSYSTPNLQQIPARDPDIGPKVRGLFLPEENESWISADFKSQEPRLLLHYIKKRGLADDHPLIQQAVQDARADFHSMVANMMGITRSHAKTVNLGIMYGMGQKKLAHQLGVDVAQAKALMEKYYETFPFIPQLRSVCEDKARSLGAIATLSGRRCRFDLWETTAFGQGVPLKLEEAKIKWPQTPLRRAYVFKSLNRLIQGSGADQNKYALLKVYEELGVVPKISIHDEICASGDEETLAGIVRCMESAVTLTVPIAVDAQVGASWGDVSK